MRVKALALAAAAVLALTACGEEETLSSTTTEESAAAESPADAPATEAPAEEPSSDEAPVDEPSSEEAPAEESASEAAPAESAEASEDASASDGESDGEGAPAAAPDNATAPGTELKLGEPAVISYDYANKTSNLEVTVLSIEKGDPKDLEELELGDQAAGYTPYYAKVKIAGVDDSSANFQYGSMSSDLDAILPDGSRGPSVIGLSDWPKCPNESAPTDFGAGKSFETCVLGLAGGDKEIAAVKFEKYDTPYDKNPIVWKK